jgi:hypothetical protein
MIASDRSEIARLRALNRKLVLALLALGAGGTATWLALMANIGKCS